MIKNDKKLSSYQLALVIICSVFGVAILQLPAGLAETTGNEGWIVLIMVGLILLFSIFLMCKSGSLYNNQGLVGASKNTFGNVLGVVLIIPILTTIFVATCTVCQIFTISIRVFLIDRTPNYAILMPFLFLVMILTRGELKDILRFLQFMIPFIIIIILGINVLSLIGADFTNLLPVFQKSPMEYYRGIQISMFSHLGIINLLVVYPYIQKRDFKSTFKTSSLSLVCITTSYLVINALCIAKLGVAETKWLIHPTISLVKSAFVPGGFIERLEGIFMSVWVIVIFATVCIALYCTAVIISDIFNFNHSKHVVTIAIPFIYIFAISIVSILDIHIINRMNDLTTGFYSIFIFPMLFLIVNKIKSKKRGESSG